MDFIWALLFFLWYEALSLPLRLALAGSPAPSEVRRLLSRVGGSALLLMPLWLAGHATGGVLSAPFAWFWILALGIGGYFCGRAKAGGAAKQRSLAGWLGYDAGHRRREAALELSTLALYLVVVECRRWIPEMTTYVIDSSAAEKFANAMMWWATWHADKLPPQDYWFSGHPLTYYYWGHFHWAWVARVGGFPPELALTLAFARMTTTIWEAATLLARSIGMRVYAAMAAGLAAAWGGNPCAVAMAWACKTSQGFNWPWYDFWKPSRALGNNVVDEFPSFSAVLGDFHAHHLSLAWSLAWMALLIGGWRWAGMKRASQPGAAVIRIGIWGGAWLALSLAAMLSNTWVLPIFGGALAVAFLAQVRFKSGAWIDRLPAQLGLVALFGLAVFLGMHLMRAGEAIPLVQESAGTAGGLMAKLRSLPVKALPPNLRSTLDQLWSMWGFAVLPLGVAAIWRVFQRRGAKTLAIAIAAALASGLLVASGKPSISPHLPGGTAWVWAGAAIWGISLALGPRRWLTRRGAWVLAASCLLLACLELLFIDDAMAGDYERYNTYFKLCYPVWPPLMIVATQAALTLGRRPRQRRLLGWIAAYFGRSLVAVWFALLMVFPVMGFLGRIARAKTVDEPPRQPTLDAFDFLDHQRNPGASGIPYFREAPMLEWIRKNVPAGDVVVEGAWVKPGDQTVSVYDFNGRVASLGGHPVPLGWFHHEMQWRGEPALAALAERQKAIDALYEAPDAGAMRQAAAALGAHWVLYGVLERNLYSEQLKLGDRPLANLKQAGRLAAAFPTQAPTIFLFEFPQPAPKILIR